MVSEAAAGLNGKPGRQVMTLPRAILRKSLPLDTCMVHVVRHGAVAFKFR